MCILLATAALGLLCPATVRGQAVWEQLPDMAGPTFQSQGAYLVVTDFPSGDADPIAAVEWWGSYWAGQDPAPGASWIRFYDTLADVLPGNFLFQEYVPSPGNETYYGYNAYFGEDIYEYHADLATPFEPVPGQTDWLSIQHVTGWWGWQSSIEPWDPWGDPAYHVSGGSPVPKGRDVAFRLMTASQLRDLPPARERATRLRQETDKLLASDGAPLDLFGSSVAVSGGVAVVGARYDDDNGHRSGSAYVFRNDGSNWGQEAKLPASDGGEFNYFGSSVGVSGDAAVVGAMWGGTGGDYSGAAYVFRYDPGPPASWIQETKLLASDANGWDYFGWSVAIAGDVAVVGAPFNDDNGDYSGSAYVFRYNGSNWVEEQKLLPSDGATEDWFGSAVAVSGDAVVIGAQYVHMDYWTGGVSTSPGSAYVFRYNGSNWVEEQKLVASDGAVADEFGCSVAVSGDVAVIGAHRDDDACPGGEAYCDSGSAYVFRYDGLNWVEQQKLLASDTATRDEFGWSVALDGDTAVIGSYRDDDFGHDSGSAYTFHFDGASWVETQKLLASDSARADHFGISVAVSGDTTVVGARCDADNGTDSGSAYVFSSKGDWDRDGDIDLDDYAQFPACLTGPGGGLGIDCGVFDFDDDTDVDLQDFAAFARSFTGSL